MSETESPDAAIDFDQLTKRQREVLDLIGVGLDTAHHPRVIKALLDRELIVEREQVLPGRFPVRIKRYIVPLHIHVAWCYWCGAKSG